MSYISLSYLRPKGEDPTARQFYEASLFVLSLLPFKLLNQGDERIWRFALTEWIQRMDQFLKEEMTDFEYEKEMPGNDNDSSPREKTKTPNQKTKQTRKKATSDYKSTGRLYRLVNNFVRGIIRNTKRTILWGIEVVENIIEQSKSLNRSKKGTMIDDENRYKST